MLADGRPSRPTAAETRAAFDQWKELNVKTLQYQVSNGEKANAPEVDDGKEGDWWKLPPIPKSHRRQYYRSGEQQGEFLRVV